MRRLRMLSAIFKRTHTYKLLTGYVIFLIISALLILIAEPGIRTFGDSLWYCYTTGVTIGFGDIVAVTMIGRIISVIISVYSLLIVGMIPAIVVSYYMEVVRASQKDTATQFMDKLEHLPELSREELEDLSDKVKKFSFR